MKTCWQIRQEHRGNGSASPHCAGGNGWRLDCGDCDAFAANVSCWELDNPRCCAPVHVSCDFCILYIVHRHEIASLLQDCDPPLHEDEDHSRNRPD